MYENFKKNEKKNEKLNNKEVFRLHLRSKNK